MVLIKVLSIWDDLEKSYENLKEHFGVTNRLDFLYKICGYANGKNRLMQLRTRMHKESKEYTAEQTSKYNDLLKIFDSLQEGLPNISVVQDLNTLKVKLMSSSYVSISIHDLNRILESTVVDTKTLPYNTFYSLYKQFDKVITSKGSRQEVGILHKFNVFKFESKNEVIELKNNMGRQSEFVKACIKFTMGIDKRYVYNTLFLLKPAPVESVKFGHTNYEFGDEVLIPSSDYKAREAVIKNKSSVVTCRVIQIYK